MTTRPDLTLVVNNVDADNKEDVRELYAHGRSLGYVVVEQEDEAQGSPASSPRPARRRMYGPAGPRVSITEADEAFGPTGIEMLKRAVRRGDE